MTATRSPPSTCCVPVTASRVTLPDLEAVMAGTVHVAGVEDWLRQALGEQDDEERP